MGCTTRSVRCIADVVRRLPRCGCYRIGQSTAPGRADTHRHRSDRGTPARVDRSGASACRCSVLTPLRRAWWSCLCGLGVDGHTLDGETPMLVARRRECHDHQLDRREPLIDQTRTAAEGRLVDRPGGDRRGVGGRVVVGVGVDQVFAADGRLEEDLADLILGGVRTDEGCADGRGVRVEGE